MSVEDIICIVQEKDWFRCEDSFPFISLVVSLNKFKNQKQQPLFRYVIEGSLY